MPWWARYGFQLCLTDHVTYRNRILEPFPLGFYQFSPREPLLSRDAQCEGWSSFLHEYQHLPPLMLNFACCGGRGNYQQGATLKYYLWFLLISLAFLISLLIFFYWALSKKVWNLLLIFPALLRNYTKNSVLRQCISKLLILLKFLSRHPLLL